jgi:hypothetical protein
VACGLPSSSEPQGLAGVALRWPLPALAVWAAAWALCAALRSQGAPGWVSLLLPTALGVVAAVPLRSAWRRALVAGGFPLSLLLSSVASAVPAWAWVLPPALLALLYPVRAWSDAPIFPTPPGALRGLAAQAPLPAGASSLDGGCGLGHGLTALRLEYPSARLHGTEWSWPLRLACAWRCRFARVRRSDLWADDWSGHDLVYLFQRPESMARAVEKARRELRPGAWLVSLEFALPGVPARQLPGERGRPVWLWQTPAAPST